MTAETDTNVPDSISLASVSVLEVIEIVVEAESRREGG
jgi:hypothetical protein